MSDKRFDTTDKKLKFIAAGNIITFKKGDTKQFAIQSIEYNRETSKTVLTGWFKKMEFPSMSALVDAIDWDWMEENCIIKDYSNI
jgi:hypothetical protein